jgi:hypothetical protein
MVSTYIVMGDGVTPCTGSATVRFSVAAVADAYVGVSEGVNVALMAKVPAAGAEKGQSAMNGVTVEVATAEHPDMGAALTVNVTAPALLVVAVIAEGAPLSAGALPVKMTVEAVAAFAAVTPKDATLDRASIPIAMPDIIFFILYAFLLGELLGDHRAAEGGVESVALTRTGRR